MEENRKRKLKKLACWLLIDLAVAIIVFALLLDRPARYNPVGLSPVADDGRKVHPYMTHELMPRLYNGAQTQKPFELVVDEKGINEAIAQSKWPQESEGVTFSAPVVLFVPGKITLMGTADIEGAKLIVTIVVEPRVDEQGLMNVQLDKVKIGAMNITPLAKIMAKKMYQERLETIPVDTEDIRTKIATSLVNNEPFDPVFDVDDKKVRVKRINVEQGKLTALLAPVR